MTGKEYNLIQSLYSYIKLLEEEGGEYARFLHTRGRQSSRIEAGRMAREKIRLAEIDLVESLPNDPNEAELAFALKISLKS